MNRRHKYTLILSLILGTFLLYGYKFDKNDNVLSVKAERTIDNISNKNYESILITIEAKEDFYIGAYNMSMAVTINDTTTILPYKVEAQYRGIFAGEDTSRLFCYFTTDAFDKYKGQNINVYYGYTLPTELAISNFNLTNEIKPLTKLHSDLD